MSIREKFFNAMRRKESNYIPFEFNLCPSQLEEFKKRTGREDYVEYFKFPSRKLQAKCIASNERFFKYFKDLTDMTVSPDFGVGRKKGSVAHFTEMHHSMENFETLEEFQAYPYPDPSKDFEWESYAERVKQVKNRDLVAIALMEVTIFEMAWYLRGMDNLMIDMITGNELVDYHLDRITGIRCEMAKRYAAAGSDVLRLGDDVSTQLDMMMSPELWRKYLKPRLARVIISAKEAKPDILVFYHGDGNLQKIIPDLIEIGVDILNPVQPECMDPVEVKKKYGDRLSFWGTLGTQTTLPFGTADEVRVVCDRMISEVGKGGGLLLAPTHVVEPEVPWENLEAYLDTVSKFNEK